MRIYLKYSVPLEEDRTRQSFPHECTQKYHRRRTGQAEHLTYLHQTVDTYGITKVRVSTRLVVLVEIRDVIGQPTTLYCQLQTNYSDGPLDCRKFTNKCYSQSSKKVFFDRKYLSIYILLWIYLLLFFFSQSIIFNPVQRKGRIFIF